MSQGSLRLRLLLAAAVSILVALLLAGLALTRIFESQVKSRLEQELGNHLLQLVSALEIRPEGTVSLVRKLADPRFEQPFSGLYWEVRPQDGGDVMSSPSLWDAELGKVEGDTVTGPEGESLIAAHRTITLPAGGGDVRFELVVATHETELTGPVDSFRKSMLYYLGLIGLALLIAAWLQVSVGLSPLKTLSRQIARISQGQQSRLTGEFPDEIAPLAKELNSVLDAQEASLTRARSQAGDLAHGLKTPLTVLAALARDVSEKGLSEEAAEIHNQAEAMRRHVERHLARARLSTGHGAAASSFRDNAERVVAAMERAPRGRDIDWRISSVPRDSVPMDRQDLLELLGNLLDNARKWARTQVVVNYSDGEIAVEDDGPGVPPEELGRIAERGIRLDESVQGTGLGLAIVRDIAEVYGARTSFGKSPLGGLEVRVRLKA